MYSRVLRGAVLPLALAAVGALGAGEAAAQARRAVPGETVVRVKLDEGVSSRDARIGEQFTATLADEDRSGFPEGTRFEGTVSEVERAAQDRPGVLDMRFRAAILPEGRRVPIDGRLASLSEEDVRRTSDGRLESRRRSSGSKFDAKWVGYGAGAGAVLATVLGGGFLKGALLGGLGGAVYGYLNRDKEGGRDRFKEVSLASGTEFGIRLNDSVAFDPRANYRYSNRQDRLDRDRIGGGRVGDRVGGDRIGGDRVAGARDEFRYSTTAVQVNGRALTFTDARPMNVNGTLYVPLAPVAEAANLRFNHRLGEDSFTLGAGRGAGVRHYVGEAAQVNGARVEGVEPLSIDGEVFVPTEWLSRVAELEVNWDRRGRRLELQAYR